MITLRPWLAADAELLATYYNNVNIWNNVRDYIPHPYTIEDANKFIAAQTLLEPTQNFAILSNENLVGGIGIILGEDVYRMNVELGYWIAEPFWGTGIATEAVRLMTEYVFQTFSINRIIAHVFEYNKTSMRVLEKNEYFLECVRRKAVLKNDYLYDEFVWVKQKLI
jgi:[ribosomal protein S5]-alanine N-acetyltransferase